VSGLLPQPPTASAMATAPIATFVHLFTLCHPSSVAEP
jgi:hypothetical protein